MSATQQPDREYVRPKVVDYGNLRELTRANFATTFIFTGLNNGGGCSPPEDDGSGEDCD